jgi:hypothetical protein
MLSRRLTALRATVLPAALVGLLLGAAVAAQPAGAVDSLAWMNQLSGKCMDIPDGTGANNTQIQLYTCNGNPWQQWNDPASGPPGYFLIKSAYTSKCLDVRNNNPNPGAAVIEYTCNASNYENWHLVSCEGSHCKIQNEGNPNYIQPSGCGEANGDGLYMNACSNGADVWY